MEKHKTCRYVKSFGELIVYVTPNCPEAMTIRGTLCSSKIRCRDCKDWKPKEDQ